MRNKKSDTHKIKSQGKNKSYGFCREPEKAGTDYTSLWINRMGKQPKEKNSKKTGRLNNTKKQKRFYIVATAKAGVKKDK